MSDHIHIMFITVYHRYYRHKRGTYRVEYYLHFQAFTGGLGTYPPVDKGGLPYFIKLAIRLNSKTSVTLFAQCLAFNK